MCLRQDQHDVARHRQACVVEDASRHCHEHSSLTGGRGRVQEHWADRDLGWGYGGAQRQPANDVDGEDLPVMDGE